MARGRMLNKKVSASLQFDQLPDDTCRLLATWIIAHLDVNGVFYADPAMVRSMVFPRRDDINIEQVNNYLVDMVDVELVQTFYADGQRWQHWTAFARNQVGLRRDRETTHFPLPPDAEPESSASDDGKYPANIPHDDGKMPAEEKLSKVNSTKVNSTKENTAGDKAPAKPPKQKRPRTPKQIEQDKHRAVLVEHFCEVSGLSPPAYRTKAQKSAAGKLWHNPLLQMSAACDGDVERTKNLMLWAIENLDGITYTVASPNSILKTALAEQAKRKRSNTKPSGYATGLGEWKDDEHS